MPPEISRANSQLHEERTSYQKTAHRILAHPAFDVTFGAIIILNLVFVILETDSGAKNEAPATWVEVGGWTILIIFVCELSLRLFVHRYRFWFDAWNLVDFSLVFVDVLFNIIGMFFGSVLPISFLRVVRLCKLARVAKVFRVCPELRLMMAGLIGSVKAIFWGTVLLVFAVLIWAIIAVQFIHPLNTDLHEMGAYGEDCERCQRAYGSVFDASLTLCWQIIAGDSWGTVNLQVIEYAPASSIFYVLVFLSVGMALLNLILGVVVDVASQARADLCADIETDVLISKQECKTRLLAVCTSLDEDQNGEISHKELFEGYDNHIEFRKALDNMDICWDDLQVLWTILDSDKSGSVSYTEFVANCYRLKTSQSHFMLAYIKYYIECIKDKICTNIDSIKDIKTELAFIEENMTHPEVSNGTEADGAISKDDEQMVPANLHTDGDVALIPHAKALNNASLETLVANAKRAMQELEQLGTNGAQVPVEHLLPQGAAAGGCSERRLVPRSFMEKLFDDASVSIERFTNELEILNHGIKHHGKPFVQAKWSETNQSSEEKCNAEASNRRVPITLARLPDQQKMDASSNMVEASELKQNLLNL